MEKEYVKFKLPTINEVEFEIEVLEEDIPVNGNVTAIDDETDFKNEQVVISEIEKGNVWVWCTVKVTASYKQHEGSDYLGCCSYKDQSDFVNNSGYYEDMKKIAYNELIIELKSLND